MATWVVRGHEGLFKIGPLPVFSVGGHRRQFWRCQGVHSLTVSIQHFPGQLLCRVSIKVS